MLNLIVVHDHASPDLGANCALCHQHLLKNIDVSNFVLHDINGDSCDSHNIQSTIASFNEASFIFIAYCHGSLEGLTSFNHGNYVNVSNSYFFASSLFYTNACHSGASIKQALMYNKCTAFVGYDDEVKLPYDELDDILFIECENFGILEFLNSDKQIGLCVEEMKEMFIKRTDELYDQDRNVLAARLALNMSLLSTDGDMTVTKVTL